MVALGTVLVPERPSLRQPMLGPFCHLLGQEEHLVGFAMVGRPDQLILGQHPVMGQRSEPINRPVNPAGMHGAEPVILEKQRQAAHPVQNVARLRIARWELIQKGPVLADILGRMRAKRLTSLGMRGVEMQGVELVVAHDGPRLARIDQAANRVQDGPVVGASIDEIPKKDDLTIRLRMEPTRRAVPPAECGEGRIKLGRLAVDIWNDVKCGHAGVLVLSSFRQSVQPRVDLNQAEVRERYASHKGSDRRP